MKQDELTISSSRFVIAKGKDSVEITLLPLKGELLCRVGDRSHTLTFNEVFAAFSLVVNDKVNRLFDETQKEVGNNVTSANRKRVRVKVKTERR